MIKQASNSFVLDGYIILNWFHSNSCEPCPDILIAPRFITTGQNCIGMIVHARYPLKFCFGRGRSFILHFHFFSLVTNILISAEGNQWFANSLWKLIYSPYFKISSDDEHRYTANTLSGEEINCSGTLD